MHPHTIIRRVLLARAAPQLIYGIVVGSLAGLHIMALFAIGSWLGPFILWFIHPTPSLLPTTSGVLFVGILFVALLRTDERWWITATYDSKTQGEIPLAESHVILHRPHGLGLPADMQVFGPASLSLVAKLIAMPTMIGPAAFLSAVGCIRESWILLSADTKRLADLVRFVHANGGRVSYTALDQAFSPGQLRADIDVLSRADCVVALNEQMHGIALVDWLDSDMGTTAEPPAATIT